MANLPEKAVAAINGLPMQDNEPTRLRDLTPYQWRSGIAAWLGWLFDGLDMHLYTLVATPFVAQLLFMPEKSPEVDRCGSIIQAGFLVGWAVGGGFFGFLGDRLGRARALMLTILTYALFTGLSFFVQTWWQLLLCRFLAALGIGGEWAVGASLLSETWPKRWRPWIAAVLQTAVNCGVLLAMGIGWAVLFLASLCVADGSPYPYRWVFLVGVLPAFLVLWIRRAVPETGEWESARRAAVRPPQIGDLFRGSVRRITLLTLPVCALMLTAHWAFMYWFLQHINNLLLDAEWLDSERVTAKSVCMVLVMVTSIIGNFAAAALARWVGYRIPIVAISVLYFLAMTMTYGVPRLYGDLIWGIAMIGLCQGVFALFTMYLPPLFPTLLRTTGAGFCYNIGRLVAAFGTVFFGMFSQVSDHRMALLCAGFLFLPAAVIAWRLPEPNAELGGVAVTEFEPET